MPGEGGGFAGGLRQFEGILTGNVAGMCNEETATHSGGRFLVCVVILR